MWCSQRRTEAKEEKLGEQSQESKEVEDVDACDEDGMVDYEKERLANIRRNQQVCFLSPSFFAVRDRSCKLPSESVDPFLSLLCGEANRPGKHPSEPAVLLPFSWQGRKSTVQTPVGQLILWFGGTSYFDRTVQTIDRANIR